MGIEQFIDNEVKANDVVLFMKGTPQFPMCGFSGQVVQILDHLGVAYKGINVLESDEIRNGIKSLFELADNSAALRQGRVCRRLRHRARDVPGRRIAADAERQGRVRPADRLTRRQRVAKLLLVLATIADLALAALLVGVSGFMFGGGPESMHAGALAAAVMLLAVIACLVAPIAGFAFNRRGKPGSGWRPHGCQSQVR